MYCVYTYTVYSCYTGTPFSLGRPHAPTDPSLPMAHFRTSRSATQEDPTGAAGVIAGAHTTWSGFRPARPGPSGSDLR